MRWSMKDQFSNMLSIHVTHDILACLHNLLSLVDLRFGFFLSRKWRLTHFILLISYILKPCWSFSLLEFILAANSSTAVPPERLGESTRLGSPSFVLSKWWRELFLTAWWFYDQLITSVSSSYYYLFLTCTPVSLALTSFIDSESLNNSSLVQLLYKLWLRDIRTRKHRISVFRASR